MQPDRVKPLPVAVDGHPDESAVSYLFRAFDSNGLTLLEAKQWLQIKSWKVLSASEVRLLAWVLRVESSWLMRRTIIAIRRKDAHGYGFVGHEFGVGAINFEQAGRLCPACVKKDKIGKASWLVKGVSGCHEHGLQLIDRCPRCHRHLYWNRPAVDICSCGYFLSAIGNTDNIPIRISNWLKWAEIRLGNVDTADSAARYGLPSFLSSLSIDGAFRVVLAFGLLRTETESPGQASQVARSSIGMTQIIARGLERLLELSSDFGNICTFKPVLHVPVLERMKATSMNSADAQCASLLIELLRPEGHPESKWQRRVFKGQMAFDF